MYCVYRESKAVADTYSVEMPGDQCQTLFIFSFPRDTCLAVRHIKSSASLSNPTQRCLRASHSFTLGIGTVVFDNLTRPWRWNLEKTVVSDSILIRNM